MISFYNGIYSKDSQYKITDYCYFSLYNPLTQQVVETTYFTDSNCFILIGGSQFHAIN